MTDKSRVGTLMDMNDISSMLNMHLGVTEDEPIQVALIIEERAKPGALASIVYTLEEAENLHHSLGDIIRKIKAGMSAEEISKSMRPN